ncbi:MAG: NAD-dependent epimerase/dehydratase family protein [Chitinophagales bacterium]
MNLITGVTGLVGAQLARRLVANGEPVRGLKRASSSLDLLGDAVNRIEWVEGDVTDIFSLEEAMRGVSKVYHAAAMISFSAKDADHMMKINVEGTANLVNIALEAGVEHALLVSSVAAFGVSHRQGALIDESFDARDAGNNYTYFRSKLHAEREWWRGIAEGMRGNILSPGTILGGGFWVNQPNNLFDAVYKGYPFYTTGGNGFVDVRDVVSAAIQISNSTRQGEKFIAVAENQTFQFVLSAIAAQYKKKAPSIELNAFLAAAAWRLESVKSALTGSSPLITKESARLTREIYRYSSEKLKKELGFKFRPLQQTIADVAALYLRSHQENKSFGILE